MTNQTPSIGQSVHYVGYGPDGAIPPYTCLAATVTALHEEACGDGTGGPVSVTAEQ